MKLLGSIICVILVLGVVPAAAQSGDICESIVIPQLTSARLDINQYGPVLGCEQVGSTWRMRSVSELASANGGNATTEQGRLLQKQVDAMAMDSTFTYSLKFGRTSSLTFTIGTYNKSVRTDIGEQGIGQAPAWVNNYSKAYARDMEVYLLNNGSQNPELIQYLEWFMARRDATLQSMSSSQNSTASTAFLANWGFMQWPWPWQIADPIAIEEYVRTLPTQELPSTESEPHYLEILPSDVSARAGDIVILELRVARLQGVHSVAFMVYAEQMAIMNIPLAYIDTTGDGACSQGSEGDPVRPIDRATDLAANPDVIPSYLELAVDGNASIGDRLAVCVEMFGFGLDQELFSWNARIDVRIVG